jgi:hypothetical protein
LWKRAKELGYEVVITPEPPQDAEGEDLSLTV